MTYILANLEHIREPLTVMITQGHLNIESMRCHPQRNDDIHPLPTRVLMDIDMLSDVKEASDQLNDLIVGPCVWLPGLIYAAIGLL